MKKIGIIGTRKKNGTSTYRAILDQFLEIYEEGDWIVSGGCRKGGDRFADKIAKDEGIPILTIYPNYKRYGRGATLVRNGPVAEISDVIIASVMNPEDGIDEVLKRKSGGTEDTLRKYTKRDGIIKEVYLV